MALGLSQNTREIVSMRQRLFASQEADARAASRNASLLRDLEASLGTLKRQSHVRLVVHVADATGHGLTASLQYCSDDYPNGTPDQCETTAATLARLKGTGVDAELRRGERPAVQGAAAQGCRRERHRAWSRRRGGRRAHGL